MKAIFHKKIFKERVFEASAIAKKIGFDPIIVEGVKPN